MEWISVEARFPDLGQRVLVWFGNEDEPYMDVWTFTNNNQHFSRAATKKKLYTCVTHWQPLPAPPQ